MKLLKLNWLQDLMLFLTDNGAVVVESKDWANVVLHTKLKISKKVSITLVNITAEDAAAIDEFDRLAKINNDILRHMIVKLEA